MARRWAGVGTSLPAVGHGVVRGDVASSECVGAPRGAAVPARAGGKGARNASGRQAVLRQRQHPRSSGGSRHEPLGNGAPVAGAPAGATRLPGLLESSHSRQERSDPRAQAHRRVPGMMMRAWWDRFWFRPEAAINLRAAHVVLAANALWLLLSRPNLPDIIRWPRPFWLHADAWLRARFLIFPVGYALEMTLYVALMAALLLVIAGRFVRPAAITAGLLIYHFAPFEDIFTSLAGPFFRGFTVPLLGLLIAWFACVPRRAADPSPEHRWPLALIQLLFAFAYLLSGISKMRLAGLSWGTGPNFEGLVLGMVVPDVAPPWANWFIGHPLLCWLGAVNGMAMDFGFIAAAFFRLRAKG